jgi:PAS domain S-box-containing protein
MLWQRDRRFRPFAASGRRTIAAIMLAFSLYTVVSLFLATRTAHRSRNDAVVLQVAARQRTLAERYTKEVLLARTGSPSAAGPVAHALKRSAAALLDGGVAPAVDGDDDGAELAPLRGSIARKQLHQEQRLIHDLVATGDAVLAGSETPPHLTAHERPSPSSTQLDRLVVLTGLTSNVSLNVARTIGHENDRTVSSIVSLERILAAVGLLIFGLLTWALVTATRRRSAHFRSLVTSTTDLVLAFTEGRCRYASNSVVLLLGCDDAAVLGEGILGFIHPDDRARVIETLRIGAPETLAFRLPDAERGWRELEANVTDLREDRHVRGVVLNARDVTERNRAAAERERLLDQERLANERLRQLDRLKDEFVALVSHEVRTPLTSIRGYLELLSDEQLTADQREYTEIIERNAERLLRLINDLLFIAQIENGQLTVEHDDVDLSPLVGQALTAAAPTARAARVDLGSEVEASLPITGDAGRLAQLIDNLISNAIKFTPAGGSVEVAAGRTSDAVWIEVRDTGIGISAEDQERLFNKFFRTRAATKSSIQGTGLGLAISKAIVQAHGGEIRVSSAEDAGTTFRVELPVRVRNAHPAPV